MMRWTAGLWLAATALADITITDIEERQYRAADFAITGEEISFTEVSGKKHKMSCQDLVELALKGLQPKAKFAPADVRVVLTDGEILQGKLSKQINDSTFQLSTLMLGDVPLKFAQVDRIEVLNNRQYIKPRPDIKGFDIIQFNTGNADPGTMTAITATLIKYTDKDETSFDMNIADVSVVYFARMQEPPKEPSTLYSLVTLTDETMLKGRIDRVEEGLLHLTTLYGTTHKIPVGSLSSIHFRNGRVVYLSDLTPSKVDENPNYIRLPEKRPSDLEFPYQKDRNVKGGKLQIRGREYKKGVGVHARSILEYTLEGQFDRFLCELGIDDVARGRGHAVFEIEVDGKRAFEPVTLTGQDEPRAVSVPVRGAQTMRLIVHFGEEGNTGDCADWAMARLIRK